MLSRFSLYFEEVAKQGSIRQASERLRIASSAIDRQILQMEGRLGVKLFERTSQGLRLTAAGELMLDAVRRWRREMDTLRTHIEDLRGLRRGEVSVAVVEGGLEFLSHHLAEFRDKYPGIVYRMHVAGAQAVTDAVIRNECDLGLTVNPTESPGLRVERTLIYQIGAVVPSSHELAKQKEISVLTCNDYPLIIPAANISLRAVIDEAWEKDAGTSPRAVAIADSISSIKSLTKAGLGVGLLTKMDVMSEIRDGNLCFVHISGKHIPLSVFSVVSASGRTLSVPASLLLQHLGNAMMAEDAPHI